MPALKRLNLFDAGGVYCHHLRHRQPLSGRLLVTDLIALEVVELLVLFMNHLLQAPQHLSHTGHVTLLDNRCMNTVALFPPCTQSPHLGYI